MYARIVTVSVKPEAMHEAVTHFKEAIMPAMASLHGFIGATLFINEAGKTVISISRWETETDMQAAEASGYLQANYAKAARLFTAPPLNEHFIIA